MQAVSLTIKMTFLAAVRNRLKHRTGFYSHTIPKAIVECSAQMPVMFWLDVRGMVSQILTIVQN
jgi:hypothetical protein